MLKNKVILNTNYSQAVSCCDYVIVSLFIGLSVRLYVWRWGYTLMFVVCSI